MPRCASPWHCGGMPTADTVLLPLCLGLTLLGIIVTALAWRRGNRGRVVQGVGLALAPVALYLSGLMRLLWDGGVALVRWAGDVVLSPQIWAGLALLALCLVLWVVGGVVARRNPGRRPKSSSKKAVQTSASRPTVTQQTAGRGKAQPAPVDDEMAEIEALLKSRGIE